MQPTTPVHPPLRQNLEMIPADLETFGLAILENAMLPDELEAMARDVKQLAATERAQGTAFLEDGNLGCMGVGPNQRLFGLISKGESFRALAQEKKALAVVKQLFGKAYGLPDEVVSQAGFDNVLLSSLTANIVNHGGVEMAGHADQGYMPVATPYAGVVNVIWLLSDFTAENGATRIAPRSHLANNPLEFHLQPPQMLPVVAPAGSAVFLDGRTWHATGCNTNTTSRMAIFAYYCRPFVRQQENYALTISPELLKTFDENLKQLLGFEAWYTLGGAAP